MQGASAEEKEMAQNATGRVASDHEPITINEGEEPAEFWSSLGGESEYEKGCDGQGIPLLVPRLFHCHVSPAGKLRVEEISHFKQEVITDTQFFTQFYWLWKPRRERFFR
jgi:gelsolin